MRTRATPLPTVLFIHGGGFVIGSVETHDNQARAICRATRSVVVSLDYRLAPETKWPGAVEDSYAALQWAAEHIGELGGDPDQLAIAGDSAGGNLAAVTALLARDAGPALCAQLLIYPVVDFDPDARLPVAYRQRRGLLPHHRRHAVVRRATTCPRAPTRTTRASRRCWRPTWPACRRPSFSPRSSTRCATRARPTRPRWRRPASRSANTASTV